MLQSVVEGLDCLLEAWELKECAGDTKEPGTRQGEDNSQAQECWEKEPTALDHLLGTGSESDDPFKVKPSLYLLKRYPGKFVGLPGQDFLSLRGPQDIPPQQVTFT